MHPNFGLTPHALYPTLNDGSIIDSTSYGYEWKITDYALTLSEQPWYLFAGGWGEVGEFKETTGPLGPWYKHFALWYESEMLLSEVASVNDVIIVPNKYYLSSSQREHESKFEAPDNMVIAGRRHKGDENGDTCCLYASLKAINGLGLKNPGTITLENQHWTAWVTESSSNIQIPSGYVITGREHNGDENGKTRYRIAKVKFNGIDTTTIPANDKYDYQYYPESAGVFFQTEPYLIFTGRTHTGDENDLTVNYQSILKVNF